MAVSVVETESMVGGSTVDGRRRESCKAPKYQRDPRRSYKCLRNKFVSERVGSILCLFGGFSIHGSDEIRNVKNGIILSSGLLYILLTS